MGLPLSKSRLPEKDTTMEPRISTLLDISRQEESTQDLVSLIPPSSSTQKPGPLEPTSVGEETLVLASSTSEDFGKEDYHQAYTQRHMLLIRPKSGAPIAQVLNNEAPMLYAPQPMSTALTPSAAPFSGRLIDLLLDSPKQMNQRQELEMEQRLAPHGLVGCQNSVIKLPKLPQLPRKTTRRPRIPPLLQGLHQPPPLPPEGKLFPPITGAKTAFESNLGERGGFDTRADVTRSKEAQLTIIGVGTIDTNRSIRFEGSKRGHDAAPEDPSSRGTTELGEAEIRPKQASEVQNNSRCKRGKKRMKWSEQETRNLLLGVSRFGIGNWKKILQSPDLLFNRRTAVDLKDRFRVCCPGEGLKSRKSKRSNPQSETHPMTSLGTTHAIKDPKVTFCVKANSDVTVRQGSIEGERGLTQCKTITELAGLGIHEPFPKSTRRPRRGFSAYDDINLLKGFEKYGPVWHAMRDDTELEFATRHPTDLRDRFRTRYPEKYAKAGYKLKQSRESIVKDTAIKHDKKHVGVLLRSPNNTSQTSSEIERHNHYINSNGLVNTSACFLPKTSNRQSLGYVPYLCDSLPTLLGEDAMSDDGNGEEGPITLNRNILQWADANPSTLSAFPSTSTNTQVANQLASLPSTRLIMANDGLDINPLVTLMPQSSIVSSHNSQIANAQSGSFGCDSSGVASTTNQILTINPDDTNMTSNDTAIVTIPSNELPETTSIPSPRTPNLPTIVFPYVPVASARTTIHNLPTPADLLSGIDLDKAEPQGIGYMLDDVLVYMTSS